MLFKREELKDILNGSSNRGQVMDEWITDTSRWHIYYTMVFKYKHPDTRSNFGQRYKYYMVPFRRGATEMQDEGPFECEGEEIECEEVTLKEVKVHKWVPVEQTSNIKEKEDN